MKYVVKGEGVCACVCASLCNGCMSLCSLCQDDHPGEDARSHEFSLVAEGWGNVGGGRE